MRGASSIIDPRFSNSLSIGFPNLTTIQDVNTTSSKSGQPIETSDTDIAGLVDLPSNLVYTRANEERDSKVEAKVRTATDKINGYYPQITSRAMRAIVDGVMWRIRGVEFDTLQKFTTLNLESINNS